MTGTDNADAKWSENNVEGEDGLRTVNCLRGRLLAERMASRNAREEAEQLGNKLLELENRLKEEAKSRNRAEKKLKFFMRRLESMNVSYVTDESEQSVLLDKTEISSVSSRVSSRTKEAEKSENLQMNLILNYGSQDSMGIVESQKGYANLQENDPQLNLWSLSCGSSTTEGSSTSSFDVNLPEFKGQKSEMGSNENPISSTADDCLNSGDEKHSENTSQLNSNQIYNDSTMDEQRMKSSTEKGFDQEDDQDLDNHVDNQMALVPVEMPKEKKRIDPEIFDATVKEVLESLKRAKEQLQSSMERRRMSMAMSMIKVG